MKEAAERAQRGSEGGASGELDDQAPTYQPGMGQPPLWTGGLGRPLARGGAVQTRSAAPPGDPLPHRGKMERAFGQDFGGVDVRLNRPAELAPLGAAATAEGEKVTFASPTPDAVTVAHELAHVVQHRQSDAPARAQARSTLSSPSDPAEVEAESVAHRAARGEAVSIQQAPGAGVLRSPADLRRLAQTGDNYHALNKAVVAAYGPAAEDEAKRDMDFQAILDDWGKTVAELQTHPRFVLVLLSLMELRDHGDVAALTPATWPFFTNTEGRNKFFGLVRATTGARAAHLTTYAVDYAKAALDPLDRNVTNDLMSALATLPTVRPVLMEWGAARLAEGGRISDDQKHYLLSLKHGFNVPFLTEASADGGRGVTRDWKVPHLERMGAVWDSLPAEHTKDNPALKEVIREKRDSKSQERGGKVWGGFTEISGQMTIGGGTSAFGATENFKAPRFGSAPAKSMYTAGDPLAEVQSKFDYVLRHEIGHAVDARINASDTYGATPHGGAWQRVGLGAGATVYADLAVEDPRYNQVRDALNGAARRDAAAAPVTGAEAEAAMTAALNTALQAEAPETMLDVLMASPFYAGLADASQNLVRTILSKGVGREVLGRMGSNPWALDNGVKKDLNGRCYQSKGGSWISYANDARQRKVSNYQFSAPAEWFAEAYAAFYEPGGELGFKLKAADPFTWAFMKESVHGSGAPLQIEAVQARMAELEQAHEAGGVAGMEAAMAPEADALDDDAPAVADAPEAAAVEVAAPV